MNWFVRTLGVAPLDQAWQNLLEAPGAFWLRDEETTYFGAFPSDASRSVDPEPELAGTLGSSVPRWIGLLPYEAFRAVEGRAAELDPRPPALLSCCEWRRYPAVAVVDGRGARVEGDDERAVERLSRLLLREPPRLQAKALLDWAAPPAPGPEHEARVQAALSAISAGQLYQVNLARRFELRAEGHPLSLLFALGEAAQAPYSAALEFDGLGVVSGSPELFLDATSDGRLETRPIKGTRPRGASPAEDLELRTALELSEKEQAELTMVIDLERNDLGRIAEVGSVRVSRLPHVVTHPTVHHRQASVVAQLRKDVDRSGLLAALLPSGSVTGAPKKKAMDTIRLLESERRGLYTGALGTLSHDGRLRLSMAIRVLTLRGSLCHYYAGGGIVADSLPAAELSETWWKTRLLSPLLDVEKWAQPKAPG